MIRDAFADLAPYYDRLMAHVSYDRWLAIVRALADLLPSKRFRHLDLACGTGVLAKRLLGAGWETYGVDLSPAMLRVAIRGGPRPLCAAADMRALPFLARFDYVTCLFDSMNFLTTDQDLCSALVEVYSTLKSEGLFYFDLITERMVREHYEDQIWTERNGRLLTTWESVYDRESGVATTAIRVNRGPLAVIRERVHPFDMVRSCVEKTGFTLLGAFDAETWKPASHKSLRMDVVAWKGDPDVAIRQFKSIREDVRRLLH